MPKRSCGSEAYHVYRQQTTLERNAHGLLAWLEKRVNLGRYARALIGTRTTPRAAHSLAGSPLFETLADAAVYSGRTRGEDPPRQPAFRAGKSGEFGTCFIGYSRTSRTTEQMLENMFVGRPPGRTYDRLLDFTRALTGRLVLRSSSTFLRSLGDD